MFGLGSRNTQVYGALFDISSDSVGVALLESDSTEALPKLIFAHRVRIRLPEQTEDLQVRIRFMREALFSASLILSRDGIEALRAYKKRAKVTKIFISCASPWSHVLTRTVEYEGEEEMKITRALIDDLVKSAEAEIDTADLTKDFPKNLDLSIVERATVDVRVNDYPIKNPLNLSGISIALTHVTGLIPDTVIKMIYEVQEKIFPGTALSTHTFMLTAYCVLREHYTDSESLCMVSATGETIELGITEGGTLIESLSIPLGSHMLVRNIMAKTKKTAADVLSLIALYTDDRLEESAKHELDQFVSEYTTVLKEKLTNLFHSRRIPKQIMLLTDPLLTPFYTRILTPVLQELGVDTNSILSLEESYIDEIAYKSASDLHLSLMARFFHKLHGCGEISL